MKIVHLTALTLLCPALAVSCGGTPAGTQPHAMSASEHEAAAQQEEQASESHQDQFDPGATATKKSCNPARGSTICWTSEVNPTEQHSKDASKHRELAAKHRAASDALRTAEASACAGISEADRDMSPFSHREDIRDVKPYREEFKVGRAPMEKTTGAEVTFNAVPGLTAEWLQRIVDCHLARNAAMGHEASAAEMPYCPLTLRGAQAKVRSVGDGFAVTIRSDDDATAKEILKRAQALAPSAAE